MIPVCFTKCLSLALSTKNILAETIDILISLSSFDTIFTPYSSVRVSLLVVHSRDLRA